VEHGQEAPGRLVVAGRDCSESLKVMEEALDAIAQPIEAPIQRSAPLATRVRMNDSSHSELTDTFPDPVAVVAGVTDESPSFGVNQHFLGNRGFVLLPGSHFDVEWLTARRCDGVNFR
jgi:hypothetical protein